jgi:hypothetical protein
MHLVAGVEHLNSFPLLTMRLCESLQWCVAPEKYFVTLHYDGKLTYVYIILSGLSKMGTLGLPIRAQVT